MNKREGAKAMFEQSLLYLLDAYRSDGMSVEQAKQKVLENIAEAEKKYADAQILPDRKSVQLGDPIKLIDEIIQNMKPMEEQSKLFYKAIVQKLIRLKSILAK